MPWELPPEAAATQRLYRIRYQGPEGHLTFKLTLYLDADRQFRMQAADPVGRQLWSLSVDAEDRALWLNHREGEFCRAGGATALAIVPLARLPLVALPKLLLGRFPVRPAAELERSEEEVSFRDAAGLTWHGALEDGSLRWWSMVEGGEPVAWWRREGEAGGIFSDRRGQQQVRWGEVVHEPLLGRLEPEPIPPHYREGVCAVAAPEISRFGVDLTLMPQPL